MVDSDLVKDKGLTTGATPPDTADVLLPPFTPAPDLTLAAMPGQSLTLSGLAGQSVILAFYPADWSPVCGDQMALYNEVLSAFRDYGAELIGLSVDSAWCHAAFAQSRNLEFPLLADFEPKGAVAKAYRAYREADGFAQRALYVIDKNGVIFWNFLSPVEVNPGADGILARSTDCKNEEWVDGDIANSGDCGGPCGGRGRRAHHACRVWRL